MPEPEKKRKKRGIIRRLLLWGTVFSFLAFGFMVCLIGFLPRLISSSWFKISLETQASGILGRSIHLHSLRWRWTEGISVSGLRLEDDPKFSDNPMISVGSAGLKLRFDAVRHDKIFLNIDVKNLNVNLIRDRNGKTNIEALLEKLAGPDEKPSTTEPEPGKGPETGKKEPISLPLDVQTRIELSEINFKADDKITGALLELQHAGFKLDAPSVLSAPINLDLGSRIILDGNNIPPVSLKISAENIFDEQGMLDIENSKVKADAELPGTRLAFSASAGEKKVLAELDVDLAELFAVAKAFLPPETAGTLIKGKIGFFLEANAEDLKKLVFDTRLDADAIAISGGLLEKRRIGPVDAKIAHKGNFTPETMTLIIDSGQIALFEKTRIGWKCEIDAKNTAAIKMNVTAGPIMVNARDIFTLAMPFVPENITWDEKQLENLFLIDLEKCLLNGVMPEGESRVQVDNLAVNLPRFKIKDKENEIETGKFLFTLDKFIADIKNLFPKNVDLKASFSLDSINIKGPQKIEVRKVKMEDCSVKVADIENAPKSMFGVKAAVTFDESFGIGQIKMPGLINIKDFSHFLSATCKMAGKSLIDMSIGNMKMTAPRIDITDKQIGKIATGLDMTAAVKKIIIRSLDPLSADVRNASASIGLKKMLKVKLFSADAVDLGKKAVSTKGRIEIFLSGLPRKIVQMVHKKFKIGGKLGLDWQFSGRLPNDGEIAVLTKGNGINLKSDIGFIDKIAGFASAQKLKIYLPVEGNGVLDIGSVSTPDPFSWRFNRKTGKGLISGKANIKKIARIPGKGRLKKPLNLAFTIKGKHNGIQSLDLSQALTISPLKLTEKFDIRVYNMDRILKKTLTPSFDRVFKNVGADIKTGVMLADGSDFSMLVPELKIGGSMNMGMEISFIPKESIGVKTWSKIPGMDISFGDMIKIIQLKSGLNLEKTLKLSDKKAKKGKKTAAEDESALSVEVMKSDASSKFLSSPETSNEVFKTLKRHVKEDPALSFQSVHVNAAPLPVTIDHSLFDFFLDNGLPNLDYFQVDFLGGTILGAVTLLKRQKEFYIRIQLAFSGLDTSRFLSQTQNENKVENASKDTEISGQMAISFPLAGQIDGLLSGMNADIRFSHIGALAFDRLLYAIDPYESNEAVVSQRGLVRTGSPKWIHVNIKNGNLSLSGQIQVKGVPIDIPRVERLNITSIVGLEDYEEHFATVRQIIELLNIASAKFMAMDEKGNFIFK
ncbi:hypothetical protein QUF76_05895 [Desulfobacterales bacterium HSG16]|nr:hypothetical protein [Desulfobacterales bacterium HSG16]